MHSLFDYFSHIRNNQLSVSVNSLIKRLIPEHSITNINTITRSETALHAGSGALNLHWLNGWNYFPSYVVLESWSNLLPLPCPFLHPFHLHLHPFHAFTHPFCIPSTLLPCPSVPSSCPFFPLCAHLVPLLYPYCAQLCLFHTHPCPFCATFSPILPPSSVPINKPSAPFCANPCPF